MRRRLNLCALVFSATLTGLTALAAPHGLTGLGGGLAMQSSATPRIRFRGTEYVLRSSEGNERTFTPVGQEDLSTFTDMLNTNLYPTAHDQQALATITTRTRAVAENAKATILPPSPAAQREDEHFFAAVLPRPHGTDFDAARFVLVDNHVVGIFYTHRSYGASADGPTRDWATKNAADVEQQLMRIDALQLLSPASTLSSPSSAAANTGLPAGTIQAGTLTSPLLMHDTMLGVSGKVATLGCDRIEDVTRYVVTPYAGAPRYRQWQEKWIVKGCGKQYPVDISFKEDGAGGADWTIKN